MHPKWLSKGRGKKWRNVKRQLIHRYRWILPEFYKFIYLKDSTFAYCLSPSFLQKIIICVGGTAFTDAVKYTYFTHTCSCSMEGRSQCLYYFHDEDEDLELRRICVYLNWFISGVKQFRNTALFWKASKSFKRLTSHWGEKKIRV